MTGLAARIAASLERNSLPAAAASVSGDALRSGASLMPTLQPPGNVRQRAALPVERRAAVGLIEARQLERLAVELLQRREREAEPQALRGAPLRLPGDHDQRDVAARRLVLPQHLEPAPGIAAIEDRRIERGAVRPGHRAEVDVLRLEGLSQLEMARILGEHAAAGDRRGRRPKAWARRAPDCRRPGPAERAAPSARRASGAAPAGPRARSASAGARSGPPATTAPARPRRPESRR